MNAARLRKCFFAFLIGLILFIIREWLAIITMIAIIFFYYIQSTVAPEEAEYRITNQGLVIGERKILWMEIDSFWFSEKWDKKILNLLIPRELIKDIQLIIPLEKQSEIEAILRKDPVVINYRFGGYCYGNYNSVNKKTGLIFRPTEI